MKKNDQDKYLFNTDYDIFIKGETIDLCVPSDDKWVLDQWYRWFNRDEITAYLAQGIYPNTLKSQKAFYDTLGNNKSRIVLLIKPKDYDGFIGVASLSSINQFTVNGFCISKGKKLNKSGSMYWLRNKSINDTTCYRKLGLERINSSQIIDLAKWQNWQILLGYQIEGILRNKFRKGNKTFDVLMSSCLLKDYNKVIRTREANCAGQIKIFKINSKSSKSTLVDDMLNWLPQKQSNIGVKFFHQASCEVRRKTNIIKLSK